MVCFYVSCLIVWVVDTNPHIMAVVMLFGIGWYTVDKDVTLTNVHVGQQIGIHTMSAAGVVAVCIYY